MIIGMHGDLMRGATAIGLPEAMAFGQKALWKAIECNPDATAFRIYVNPYARFITNRIVQTSARDLAPKFKVLTDETYAKDSWRIEPGE